MTDVHSVGAGGGSIAWVDSGGFLHVGPRSAGADPGPACYGLGGQAPTVTDANLVLNRLIPEFFLDGEMSLRKDLAKKSIATFKLRSGMTVGCKVTLRHKRMYEFLDRLITVALPRVRDFRGLSPKSFDGFGNYALGLKEQIVFPEIDYDQVDTIRGLDITLTTTAKNDAEGRALLEAFRFPLGALKE